MAPRAAVKAHTHPAASQAISSQRFRLDSSRSKFIAHALRGGLLWFKGHEHLVAARDFSGEAEITPDKIIPASLELTVMTDSMAETSDASTEPQKQSSTKNCTRSSSNPKSIWRLFSKALK
jgi:hypothetical protein